MQSRHNIFLALLTSFLVISAGAVLYGVLYYFGVFSAWVALISSTAAFICFFRFYNKSKVLPCLWIVTLSIGLSVAALCFSLIFIYQNTYGMPFDVACSLFGDIVAENVKGFVVHLVFSVVFAVAGMLLYFAFIGMKEQKEQGGKESGKEKPKAEAVKIEPVKVGEEYIKIADFCLNSFVAFNKIEDEAQRRQAVDAFRQKFLNRFSQEIKNNIILAINQKNLSPEQKKAVEEMKAFFSSTTK